MQKSNNKWLTKEQAGWVWVAAQFVLLLALFLAPKKPVLHAMIGWGWLFLAGGLALFAAAFVALGHAFTPNPAPKHDGELTTLGVYRWIRHPMYTAVMLCALGWAMLLGGVWHYLVFCALIVFFFAKADREEIWLIRHYPGYRRYRASTGMFLPKFRKKP